MTAPSTQVTTLLTQFGLTTAAEELVPRLTQAGHPEALPVLLEVLEAEAEARRQRRIARLRRAARLPPGKTFATLDTGRLPVPVVQQLDMLRRLRCWPTGTVPATSFCATSRRASFSTATNARRPASPPPTCPGTSRSSGSSSACSAATFRDQDPVNIEASDLSARLHDALSGLV